MNIDEFWGRFKSKGEIGSTTYHISEWDLPEAIRAILTVSHCSRNIWYDMVHDIYKLRGNYTLTVLSEGDERAIYYTRTNDKGQPLVAIVANLPKGAIPYRSMIVPNLPKTYNYDNYIKFKIVPDLTSGRVVRVQYKQWYCNYITGRETSDIKESMELYTPKQIIGILNGEIKYTFLKRVGVETGIEIVDELIVLNKECSTTGDKNGI